MNTTLPLTSEVIFGEIAPQSVCVRYGLPIGSFMAPFVLLLMYLLAPIAWPTAKLLDYLLGKDHGTVYKKAGLKTLVSLHKSLGDAGQQLNSDEVTIISAVLDLKDKPIGSIMTPMADVFTLSLDDVLDEKAMDDILSEGYSRIPVHQPEKAGNFVGMLLVKMLITYDPEDAKPVREFALATLPETAPDTSCLDIINFFQEGKSHMVLVSEHPGDDHGAIGVVTLEDVIEELIGEEIVDESDVFMDVHKAVRRMQPAPRFRVPKHITATPPTANGAVADLINISESEPISQEDLQRAKVGDDAMVKKPADIIRRRSSATNSVAAGGKRQSTDDIRSHLKNIGPSNRASRPRTTRYNTVKIKPGGPDPSPGNQDGGMPATERQTLERGVSETGSDYQHGMGEAMLRSGGQKASDGVQALQQQQRQGYGSIVNSPNDKRSDSASKGVQADPSEISPANGHDDDANNADGRPANNRTRTEDTIGSLKSVSRSRSPYYRSKGPARSGSITENIVDSNGIRKVVLGTMSSSSSNDEDENGDTDKDKEKKEMLSSNASKSSQGLRGGGDQENDNSNDQDNSTTKKKKRRRRKNGSGKGEDQPLLGDRD